jgi:hypothetical protein
MKRIVIEMVFQPRINLLILLCRRSFLKQRPGHLLGSRHPHCYRTMPVYILPQDHMVIRDGTAPTNYFPPLTLFEASASPALGVGVMRRGALHIHYQVVSCSAPQNILISLVPCLNFLFCFSPV